MTSCKRTVQVDHEVGEFHLNFKTTSGGDPHGGSDMDHPTELSLYATQMDSIVVTHPDSSVTLKWHGGWEFNEFHRALVTLVRELNAVYGEPS